MPSCRVYVVVQPRSRLEKVTLVDDKTLRVKVQAPPEGGRANEAVVALLAKRLRLPKGRVLIVAGQHARKKIVVLPLSLDEVVACFKSS